MNTSELLLAYHVRALAMQLLGKRAPLGATPDEVAQYTRDHYESMVHHIMSDLDYTAQIIRDSSRL